MRTLIRYLLLLLPPLTLWAQKPINVSLVLPFCSKQILENPNHTYAGIGNTCREYYQGFLIAMDSFSKDQAPIKVNVFDTENDSLIMIKIMQKKSFQESALIIGPVLQGGNKMLSDFCKSKGIYHVSPLMTFSKTKLSDPCWISSNPDIPSYAATLYNFITKQHHDSANIIIVSDKSGFDKTVSDYFKKVTPASKNTTIRFVDYSKDLDIQPIMSPVIPNQIIISSTRENVVNAMLFKIKDTVINYSLACYGFQQWFDFKNLELNVWDQKDVHIVTPYFVDYTNSRVRHFVAAYRERYATEPSESAFKGYDQALLYISALKKYDRGFMKDLEDKDLPALHTHFLFKKQKDGGYYQNTYLHFLHFEDNVLQPVDW